MKPNDENGKLPTAERPFRVLIISGSDRRQYNCPGVDSKSRTLMMRMAERLPQDWEIDYEDLGNVYAREHIQSCNACVSTSMALCVWPCNCYEKGNKAEPDLMWNIDLYSRLDLADAWAILGPINWYAPTSNLKLMFDRLVCMNGGNPREELIEHKDAELAKRLEHSPQWEELSVNHLEGRTAGFFCYGDGGGDELDEEGRPRLLRHQQYFDPEKEPFQNDRDSYGPFGHVGIAVSKCRTNFGSMSNLDKVRNTAITRPSIWRRKQMCSLILIGGVMSSRSLSARKEKCSPGNIALTVMNLQAI